MSRRHEALIPLSHDHHHALAQARRLHDASTLEDGTERRNISNDFVNFYLGRLLRNFHEEEELFFPPVVDADDARDLVLQAVGDHLRIHGLVRTVRRQLVEGEVDRDLLALLSDAVTSHVRFEEQEVFPILERLIPEDELKDLATVGRRDV